MTPPDRQITQMLSGYWIAQALHVAAKLRLADHVQSEPRTANELAQECGAQPQALYRLLRALASVGCFAEDAAHRFGLTPLAECLLDRPGSQYALALMMGEEHYAAYGRLLDSIRTGKPAFDLAFGKPVFDFLSEHPEQARTFDAAMTGVHGPETQAMLEAYDFGGISTLVDIGGGNGSTITAVLKAHHNLKGMLYDLPGVIGRAREAVTAAGLAGRCSLVAGSFFESVPAGGDAYMMRHIIHDWDDEKSLTILRHVRRVIPPTGKLLVVESVIQPGNEPDLAKLLDLTMLVIPGGLERTEEQYRTLVAQAGFRLQRIVRTASPVCVIEGVPHAG
jgi:ubiquinone/menaquinone biosynthesis C-methylase UbiE